MTRFWEDYTLTEQTTAENLRSNLQAKNTNTDWSRGDLNTMSKVVLEFARMLMDTKEITASQHISNMSNPTSSLAVREYVHDWRMANAEGYRLAWLYTYDESFRDFVGTDGNLYSQVVLGFFNWSRLLEHDPGIVERTLNATEPPILPVPSTPSMVLRRYRGRNDNGNLTTATWKAATDTTWSQAVNTNFRVRIQIEITSLNSQFITGMQLYYRRNAGEWIKVSAESPGLVTSLTSHYTEADKLSHLLVPDAETGYIALSGMADETNGFAGLVAMETEEQHGYIEFEWSLKLLSGVFTPGDVIQLQTRYGVNTNEATNLLSSYAVTPQFTVS